MLIVVGLLQYTNQTIFTAVTETIEQALTNPNSTLTDDVIPEALDDLRVVYFVVLGGVIILAVVTGYIATQITLRPARRALELQKRFVSNISHELRTPLATLKVANEIALMGETDQNTMRETLAMNLEEIDRMKDIINTILSFDYLERSDALLFEDISLTEVIQSAVERVAPLAEKRKIHIEVTKASDTALVYGNKTALEQAVFNVLKNSIIYSELGETVTARITTLNTEESQKRADGASANLVQLAITDSGIGIAPDKLPYVFEPFFRASPARTRDDSGSGVGLSVVYEIMQLHGGTIAIESTPDKGTTVRMRFPPVTKKA